MLPNYVNRHNELMWDCFISIDALNHCNPLCQKDHTRELLGCVTPLGRPRSVYKFGDCCSNPFNTLKLRQNGRHFPDIIFKCIFLMKMYEFRLGFLRFVPKVPINNIPSLVQIMTWRQPNPFKVITQTSLISKNSESKWPKQRWIWHQVNL